jgi:hypothetical protein
MVWDHLFFVSYIVFFTSRYMLYIYLHSKTLYVKKDLQFQVGNMKEAGAMSHVPRKRENGKSSTKQ